MSVDMALTFLFIPLLLFVDLVDTQLGDACAAATSTGRYITHRVRRVLTT